MNKFRATIAPWLKQNTLVIIFALLVGTLSVLPHLLAARALDNEYKGIPFLYSSNEDLYLARIHEITEGHLLIGSPHLFEYKDQIPLLPPIGEYFYIILGFILRTSFIHTIVIAKFIFPALLFVLAYTLTSALTKKGGSENEVRWGAIAAALMVTIGCELLDYHTLFSRLLGKEHWTILSMWTRPVNPITGALLLFGFLNLFWRSIAQNSWKYTVSAGIILGFSIGYIFSFELGFTLLGVFFLFALWWKDRTLMGNIFWVGVVGIIIPLAYWTPLLPQLMGRSGLAERNGAIFMHTPLPNKVLLAAFTLLGVMFLLAKRKHGLNIVKEHDKHLALWFAIALLLDGLIVLNQQIITGITIWPYHFAQYTVPLALIALFTGMFFLLRPITPRIWKMIIGATISSVLLFSVWNATTYTYELENFRQLQNSAPIFNWLNVNAPKDCVVLTSEDWVEHIGGFVPAFTNCDIYLSGYANNANNVPEERIEHNFFVKLRLLGLTDTTITDYLVNNQDAIKGYFFKDWRELFDHNYSPRIAAMVPKLSEKYHTFMKKDFETALREYHIDYIIAQGEIAPEAKSALPNLHETYKSGTITIYQF